MNGLYIPSPITDTDARANREAFEAALAEVSYETYQRVSLMVHHVANVLVRERGMGPETAMRQALEFVAACVWHKAQGKS